MKFSKIKDKIQNLGNLKSLSEIKKAGLRICRNTKTGDYWLIEEEFLKPVIESPRELKALLVKKEDVLFKVLMCHKSKKELINTKTIEYINWGERKKFNKRPTCESRKYWWGLNEISSPIISKRFVDIQFCYFYNKSEMFVGDTFFVIDSKDKKYNIEILLFLNSIVGALMTEIIGRKSMGEGVLLIYGPEINNLLVLNRNILEIVNEKLLNYLHIHSIFEGININPSKEIREQEPNPLPDRKALDDIVFDALGLTEQERKEVYWAVCELVKSRLEKAKNV